MQHLLRAISGPQAGAVYVLGRRTTLGRASSCDIQLIHQGVSRQHAKIVESDDGTMVLSDLSSDNGTFVEGEPIGQHVLRSGEAIRIMSSRFVYELVDTDDAVTSAVFLDKMTSGDSLRQTADHRASLSAVREASPWGPTGSRLRDARPQSAAPTPSGSRPGALEGVGPELPPDAARTIEVPIQEQERLEETPARVVDMGGTVGLHGSGEYVRRRWPQVRERDESPTPPEPPAEEGGSSRTFSYGDRIRPFGRASPEDTPSAYGWHARGGPGRRELVTSTPSSLASAAMPAKSPDEAAGSVAAEVSGSAEGEGIDRPAIVSPSASPTWSRVAPPVEMPGGMRPQATLPEVRTPAPRILAPELEVRSPSRAGPTPLEHTARWQARPPTPPPRRPAKKERKGITAEYGSMGWERPAPLDGGSDARAESGAAGAGLSSVPIPQPAPVISAQKYPVDPVSGVRRAAPGEGAKPGRWDEIKRRRKQMKTQDGSDSDDFDPDERTQPRVRGSRETPASIDDDSDDSDDGGEDTIRFTRAGEASARGRSGAPSQRRREPSGPRGYESRLEEGLEVDELQRAASEASVSRALDGLSELERIEIHAQEVLERADFERRRRHGIEILLDILEYRGFRLRALQGDTLPEQEGARFVELEQRLQQEVDAEDDYAAMRRYHRFICSIPGVLSVRRAGRTFSSSIELADISAGGTKLTFGDDGVGPGDTVWLSIDVEGVERSRLADPQANVVILAARVVWTRPLDAQMGLIFIGAPTYEQDPSRVVGP